MDTSTAFLLAALAGLWLYISVMAIYRKISTGETFTLEKYATTFGYGALIVGAAYLAAGVIPDANVLLTQIMTTTPDGPTVLPLVLAIITGLFHQGIKIQNAKSSRVAESAALSMPAGIRNKITAPAITFPVSIVGIFKSGYNGEGGDLVPLDTTPDGSIQRHMFKLMNVEYGLAFDPSQDPKKTVVIDAVYDGKAEHDPHAARPLDWVTDFPANNPGMWLGYLQVPNNRWEYSATGIHTLKLMVAMRPALIAGQTTPAPRPVTDEDFLAAGGAVQEFKFLIYPDSQPLIVPPLVRQDLQSPRPQAPVSSAPSQ